MSETADTKKDMEAIERDQQSSYDKAVFVLSSGALAFSTTFARSLPDDAAKGWLVFLFLAWLSWVVCLGSVLLSHHLSARDMRMLSGRCPTTDPLRHDLVDKDRRRIKKLNAAAGWAWFAGIIFFGVFVGVNLAVR